MDELSQIKIIVEAKDYGFRFWAVVGVFYGIRSGFVIQNEYGDRRALYEEEVSFHGEKTEGFDFYAYTSAIQEAIERGFEKWQRRK